ncbi:glycosyltransferase [Aureitalea marina]|uniref:glycosyltransferase n=1 Tax=Aureitalea marina TaxID=930804 RepID=UPI001FE49F40|nr:glycosyltransferase [Aureitalea marina]
MLSVVVPILNEAETILGLLHQLRNASSSVQQEVILVDGGSEDGTTVLVQNYLKNNPELDIRLLRSQRGRARQMNLGARVAKFPILYFLHADSTLPSAFEQLIVSAWEAGKRAGCFRMRFDKSHPVLGFSQWFTRFNHPMFRGEISPYL